MLKKLSCLLLSSLVLLIVPAPLTSAQTVCVNAPRAEGLISATTEDPSSRFGSSGGTCIIDQKSQYNPSVQIPSYSDLWSRYFTQGKTSASTQKVTFTNPGITDVNLDNQPLNSLIWVEKSANSAGDLNINGDVQGNRILVVFVDGNLNINANIANSNFGPSGPNGLVFVVAGNVNIDQGVTNVNAVIISNGIICTASVNQICPLTTAAAGPTASRLIVNGNLISINTDNSVSSHVIVFRRNLVNNNISAEEIDLQPKYFVILKDLFADTLKIETELTNY